MQSITKEIAGIKKKLTYLFNYVLSTYSESGPFLGDLSENKGSENPCRARVYTTVGRQRQQIHVVHKQRTRQGDRPHERAGLDMSHIAMWGSVC